MGGIGSGRTASWSTVKCEDCLSIDIAWLKRENLLITGRISTLTWSSGGKETGSIKIATIDGGIRLIFRTRSNGEDWQDIDEFIPLHTTPTNFGGKRHWFTCLSCRRRVRILYSRGRFRCRSCWQLQYASQYETSYGRAATQAQNIRKRLGGDLSLDAPFPEKPKHMHWSTYERLREREEYLQAKWCQGIAGWLGMVRHSVE